MKGNTPNGRLLEAIGELNPHGTVMGPLNHGKTYAAKQEAEAWAEHFRQQRELHGPPPRFGQYQEEAEDAFIALFEEAQRCANSKSRGKYVADLRKAVLDATKSYSEIRMRRES